MKYATTIKNAERIIERYKNGDPTKLIAHEENVSVSSVCRLAQEAGVPKRYKAEWRANAGVPCPHCGHLYSKVFYVHKSKRRRKCAKYECGRTFITFEKYATMFLAKGKASDQSIHCI